MRFASLLLSGLLLVATGLPRASAQGAANACLETMYNQMAREHRLFRTVLFGERLAEASLVGTVKYEVDGSGWYKVDENTWQSVEPGFENTTHSDSLVNDRSETKAFFGKAERKGIFERRGVSTSELLPEVGVSLRQFQCRLEQLCDAVNKSTGVKGEEPVLVNATYPGCALIQRPSFPACHIQEEKPSVDGALIRSSCQTAVQTLLNQEAEILELAVEYDAAYRSLLQLAGSVDLFLGEMQWSLQRTIQTATGLLGQLGRIPCFLASCEAFPPPEEE